MYENLSRAVAFKLFWPWLILRNDVLHHDTHLCVYKTEGKKEKRKVSWSKYPMTWDTFWYFLFSVGSCFTNSDPYPLNWFHDPLNGLQALKNIMLQDKYPGVELLGRAARTSDVVNFSRSLTLSKCSYLIYHSITLELKLWNISSFYLFLWSLNSINHLPCAKYPLGSERDWWVNTQ